MPRKLQRKTNWYKTQQEIAAQNIEQNAVIQEYTEKLSKLKAIVFKVWDKVAGSTGDIAKLENQVATYKVRKGLYYILATQRRTNYTTHESWNCEIVKIQKHRNYCSKR